MAKERPNCLYYDNSLDNARKRWGNPKYFCGKECRAKGQMNISFMGSKATPTDNKYRKRRRGTTNAMELSAIWDILRNVDEAKSSKWIIGTLFDDFGKVNWLRVKTHSLNKKLNYFRKDCFSIDKSGQVMLYKGTKNVSFSEALSDKIKDYIQKEYEHNTSDYLKD